MKKKLLITFFTLFLLFFLISNLTIFNMYFPHSDPYRFCAAKCDFEDLELGKGHDPLGRVQDNFEAYKLRTGKNDAVLYRRFDRKWWHIWNWIDFATHPRWNYPYAERDEDT